MKKLTCFLQVLQISHHCISPNKTLQLPPWQALPKRALHWKVALSSGNWKNHSLNSTQPMFSVIGLCELFLQLPDSWKRDIWEDSLVNYLLGWRRRFGRAIIQADYQIGWIRLVVSCVCVCVSVYGYVIYGYVPVNLLKYPWLHIHDCYIYI